MYAIYGEYHAPTIRYAKGPDGWFTFPAVHDGWKQRKPWFPSEALAERIGSPANRTTFFGLPWLAEEGYGIPRDQVAALTPEEYERSLDPQSRPS